MLGSDAEGAFRPTVGVGGHSHRCCHAAPPAATLTNANVAAAGCNR